MHVCILETIYLKLLINTKKNFLSLKYIIIKALLVILYMYVYIPF